MSADQVQRLRAERFAVLRQVYEQAEGDPSNIIPFKEVVVGYDLSALERHVGYLTAKGLLNRVAQGFVGITLEGIEEYEEALSQPDRPTAHFPPQVVIENLVHIGGDMSGQMQVGTIGSTQTSGISPDDLRALLADLRDVLVGLTLEPDEEAELDSDVRSLEAQLDSPRPKTAIIREALSSTRSVLEGVAAKEAAAGVEHGVAHLPSVIERLGHALSLLT